MTNVRVGQIDDKTLDKILKSTTTAKKTAERYGCSEGQVYYIWHTQGKRKKNRTWSADDYHKIEDMWAQHKSLATIAREFNVSSANISAQITIARRLGYNIPNRIFN